MPIRRHWLTRLGVGSSPGFFGGLGSIIGGATIGFRADSANVTRDGSNRVSSWTDLAPGSGTTNATQGTAGNKPLWVSSVAAFGGRPVVRFTTDDFLVGDGPTGAIVDATVWAVTLQTAIGNHAIFDCSDTGETNRGHMLFQEGTFRRYRSGSVIVQASYTYTELDTARVHVGVSNTAGTDTVKIFQGATEQASLNATGNGSIENFWIGSLGTAPPLFPWEGDIAELWLYPFAFSSAQLSQAFAYAQAYYGLS